MGGGGRSRTQDNEYGCVQDTLACNICIIYSRAYSRWYIGPVPGSPVQYKVVCYSAWMHPGQRVNIFSHIACSQIPTYVFVCAIMDGCPVCLDRKSSIVIFASRCRWSQLFLHVTTELPAGTVNGIRAFAIVCKYKYESLRSFTFCSFPYAYISNRSGCGKTRTLLILVACQAPIVTTTGGRFSRFLQCTVYYFTSARFHYGLTIFLSA